MKVCMCVLIVVVIVVEGTKGAEAWQTAKRIKYRSTTKAVSQGRLSHKSPFDKPLLRHPPLPPARPPPRTSNLLLPRQRSATKTAPDMTKNKTADRCRYCHAECSLPPPPPPSSTSSSFFSHRENLLFFASKKEKEKKSNRVAAPELLPLELGGGHVGQRSGQLSGHVSAAQWWRGVTQRWSQMFLKNCKGGSLCWYFGACNVGAYGAKKNPKIPACFILRGESHRAQASLSRRTRALEWKFAAAP